MHICVVGAGVVGERQARLADGLHSCSEHIHGKTARDMHETCDLADHTWALAYLLQATGNARYADTIEQVIFNALPGSITKDFRALQYFSCPNQVIVTSNSNHNPFMHGLNWMSYRPDHEVQCCPGNLHRAMPNYISKMWMRAADGGIMTALYGPGELRTTVGMAKTLVTITASTRYPYQQELRFSFQTSEPVTFPFWVRIPVWCHPSRLKVNGQAVAVELQPGSFFRLERLWQSGDEVQLELPFELALEHWPDKGVSLTYGPLTLALPVPTRAEIETQNSTTRQRQQTLGDQYEPRPTTVKADFPSWNLYPDGVRTQVAHHYHDESQALTGSTLVFYLGHLLRTLGPLGLGLVAVAAVRERRLSEVVAVLVHLASTLAVLGTADVRFVRFLVPALGGLSALAGVGAVALLAGRRAWLVALGLGAALPPLVASTTYVREVGLPSTRDRALDWIAERVPPGRSILTTLALGVDRSRYELVRTSGDAALDRRLALEVDLVVADTGTASALVDGFERLAAVEPLGAANGR